jgi:hypothetical protein
MTSYPLFMPSIVAAAMTPLMPGAGPPPTRMPNLPLVLIEFRAECRSVNEISIPFLSQTNQNLP